MSLTGKRAVIDAVWKAWTKPDLEKLADLLTEDCEWQTRPALGLPPRTLAGRAAILDYTSELHERGTVERRLVDAVESAHGVATLQDGKSTPGDGRVQTQGASFCVFVFEEGLVERVIEMATRSQALTRIGLHGRDRGEALIVRDWTDPRVSHLRPDDPLVGKTLRYQRFFGSGRNDHVHCDLCWRKIMNVELDGVHRSGYVALDPDTGQPASAWVCEESFDECRKLFEWEVVATPPDAV